MPLDDARTFVNRMKEDRNFRKKALDTAGPDEFAAVLKVEGLSFDLRELVGAMAECMSELEQQMAR